MKSSSFIVKFYVNLLLSITFLVCIIFGVHRWLTKYTEHGIEVKVPNLTGMSVEEAKILLRHTGLSFEIIDSTFSKRVPLGTIVEQTPVSESNVKHGRVIYVTVNAKHRPKVKLPNLINISYRQAESVLHSINLEIAEILYTPSTYRNLVLDVRNGSKSLQEGDLIEEGSGLILVVGVGNEKRLIPMPNLIGRNTKEVKLVLIQHFLSLDSCYVGENDSLNDNNTLFVYEQYPNAGKPISEGSAVKIWMSNDTTLLPKSGADLDKEENKDEENFF